MKFRLIEDHRNIWPVNVMCEALSVSPSGYHAGGHGRTAHARSPIAHGWSTSGGSMRSTANDTEHRASTPNCAPGQTVSRKRVEQSVVGAP
jgi:hypothetical protein